jgi:hypothetical protein
MATRWRATSGRASRSSIRDPRTGHPLSRDSDPRPARGPLRGDRVPREQPSRHRRQFNLIDPASGFKIDLIVLKDRPFSREEFGRRRVAALTATLAAAVASPEDSILSKLEWARKAGESGVQLADAAGVARVAGAALDVAYIERWAEEPGVLDLWKRVAISRA